MSLTISGIQNSLLYFYPEGILVIGLVIILIAGLIKKESQLHTLLSLFVLGFSIVMLVASWHSVDESISLFSGMLRHSNFSVFMRLLIDLSAILTVLITWRNKQQYVSEYYVLILAAVVGAHALTMSVNMVMIFLSLELLSISSYLLTAFLFTKSGSEGSLKYFLFGAAASAVMLYGFSWLYGLSGTLEITSPQFTAMFTASASPIILVAGSMVLAGFLYKLAAAPMHPWSPDVYEAAPMPVVAFFSVVPKLAGLSVFMKFLHAIGAANESVYDWQLISAVIILATITVGNFSALWQKNPKRLMAYSSIAQSGFLMIGVLVLSAQGTHALLFYATVYLFMNYVVFLYLNYFEIRGVKTIADFQGLGRSYFWPLLFLLIAFIALIGLPPTSGFTAKLFVFSSLWEAYQTSEKNILLILLVVGLLNTVISLFYYLRIPYYAFVKGGETYQKTNILTFENLLGAILVFIILWLFFSPELLMGWINKITFVL